MQHTYITVALSPSVGIPGVGVGTGGAVVGVAVLERTVP